MKKRLVYVAGGLALSLAGLAMMLYARPRDERAAESAPKTAASKIVQVTVYPNSALVTREVDVPAGEGSFELVVTPLPQHTINSSLYSEGSDGIRVMTTRFRTRPIKEDTREEVRKLEDEIRKLQQNAEKLQADLEAARQNLALVGKLEGYTAASTTHATEKGKLDSQETIALAKFLMENRGAKSKEMVEIQQQLQTNHEQSEFAARKLRDLTSGTAKTEHDAVIIVEKNNAAAGKVRLNYLVDQAAWRPQYKLRAGKDPKDAVQVEYLAAIFQQTGEDWAGVELILSTAQPMLNASPPELRTLAVTVVPKGTAPTNVAALPVPNPPGQPGRPGDSKGGGRPNLDADKLMPQQPFANPVGQANAKDLSEAAQELKKQAQDEGNKRNDARGNEIFNYAAALEQARDLVLLPDERQQVKGVPRGQKNEGPSVTYHLNTKLSVPSRNDEQILEVARLDMAPEFFYKAVPVLTPHVYKQANLTNTSKYVLLPGEATMYNGKDFVGRMNLPLVAIGEQFTAGFGVDPQLQIQRQMMDKQRAQQGGNQVLKYEYRILVSSYKPEKVKVQVWDRLPQGENETLLANLVKATPELSKDALYVREEKPNNLLRWDLEVDPAMNGEKALTINYEFKIELAKDMNIGTFQSK
jgi:hypothetical protein